jgi:hypothetical protein
MTTIPPMNNNRTRKQLSEQIDRLDAILDGLSDALNESVAQAVREASAVAVREAVQGVLTELMTNPQVLAALHPTPPAGPPVPPPPTLRDRLGMLGAVLAARWHDLGQGCRASARVIQQGVAASWRGAHRAGGTVWSRCLLLGKIKKQILTALGVGVVAALLTWLAGPWLATLISGLGGFATTLAAQFGLWLRRLLGGTPCPAG